MGRNVYRYVKVIYESKKKSNVEFYFSNVGVMLGGHVRAVFTLVTIIFIICVSVTVTSFCEIPLWRLEAQPEKLPEFLDDESVHEGDAETKLMDGSESGENGSMTKTSSYGAMGNEQFAVPPAHVSETTETLYSLIFAHVCIT